MTTHNEYGEKINVCACCECRLPLGEDVCRDCERDNAGKQDFAGNEPIAPNQIGNYNGSFLTVTAKALLSQKVK